MTPSISFIVPVFNSATTLDRCLKSIIEQTEKNIEIILINDGSTDNSPTICQEYAKKDSRIIYRSLPHQGVCVARNTGIEIASGEYLTFVDSDDWVDKNICEFFLNRTQKYNYDLFIFSASYERDQKTAKCFLFKENVDTLDDTQKKEALCKVMSLRNPWYSYKTETPFMGSVWGNFYRTQIIHDNSCLFSKQAGFSEDILFIVSHFEKFKRIGFTKDIFYHYIFNKNSAQNRYRPHSADYFEFVMNEINTLLSASQKDADYTNSSNVLAIHYLFGIIKEDCFHKNNAKTFYEKKNVFEEALGRDCFKKALQNYNPQYFSIPERALVFLIRHRFIRVISIAMNIYNRIRL